jgi:hypothetical protein
VQQDGSRAARITVGSLREQARRVSPLAFLQFHRTGPATPGWPRIDAGMSADPDMFAEIPWPAAGDVLFADGPDPWMNAQLSLRRFGDSAYSAGYREAGDVLVARAAASGGMPDLLVYPIVFCYRQYLELELKGLIKVVRRSHGIDHAPLTIHNLLALWNVARDLIELRQHADLSDLDHTGEVLRQFSEVDPGSMSFRYPTDKEGAASLPDGLRQINLSNLSRVVAAVGNLLEGCSTMYLEEQQAADY